MSGTRWCQGTCVSGPGPALELWGFISYRLLCNKGLHTSSSQQDAYHRPLSGGPCGRSRHRWGSLSPGRPTGEGPTCRFVVGRSHLPAN